MLENIYIKHTIPPGPQLLLPRVQINSLLPRAVKSNLVTMTAGTGYGKTQTVSTFLKHHRYRVAWLQLSKLDNFSARFWKGFLDALSPHHEEVISYLEQLGFPESAATFDRFLHILAKEIHRSKRLVFVFDDLHLISNESINQFFENLISANIENLCIILLSRTAINFTNRLNNHFTEEDLRFSLSETEKYLKMQAISLTATEVEKIQTYTGGWPLAIYLISLNLKKDLNLYIDPLIGSKPIIFLMIEKELFFRYKPHWQEFFIKLSFLEEVPIGLMRELSQESVDTMMGILADNMFIQYNPYTCKYYFHHIFLNFLHEKQIHLNSQSIDEVYVTAAKWYEKNGLKIDAMTYYEKCRCYDEIWQLILHMPPERHPKNKASRLINFLNNFPQDFLKKHPMASVIRASFMLNNLELEPAAKDLLTLINELKAQPETAENNIVLGEAYIVLALIKLAQKEYGYVHYFKMANILLPKGSMRNYSNIKIVDSNNSLNPNSLEGCEIEKFQKSLDEAMPYASRVMHGFGYGIESLSKAEMAYFKGDFIQAQRHIFEAIYRARQKKQKDIVCNAFFLLMKITFVQGDYNATIDYMTQLTEYAENSAYFLSILDIAKSWFFLKIGNNERIPRWLLNDTLNEQIHPPISVGKDRLVRVHYFLTEERYDELFAFSRQLDTLYQKKGLWMDLIILRIFNALSFYYIGDLRQCINVFQSLYDIVHENHFVMQFIEMGQHMCAMIDNIRRFGNHNLPEDWLNYIYSKASIYAKRQVFYKKKYIAANQSEDAAYVRLTRREKEILRNLCQGLTRDEIAASLTISINTVKSALQHIYNKLGAANSADAVRIAIQMKIV